MLPCKFLGMLLCILPCMQQLSEIYIILIQNQVMTAHFERQGRNNKQPQVDMHLWWKVYVKHGLNNEDNKKQRTIQIVFFLWLFFLVDIECILCLFQCLGRRRMTPFWLLLGVRIWTQKALLYNSFITNDLKLPYQYPLC